MQLLSLLKNYFARKGTRINQLAIIKWTKLEENVGIRAFCKVERCTIGKCTYLGSLVAAYDAEIGRFCSIARECYIGGASHPLDRVSSSVCFYSKQNDTGVYYNENDYAWNNHTIIGNDVWLGARAIIKSGVTIADGAVIGAGAVVTKNVGPYEIWAGNPAKLIRKRFDEVTIKKLLNIKWWNWDDERLSKYGKNFTDVNEFLKEMM